MNLNTDKNTALFISEIRKIKSKTEFDKKILYELKKMAFQDKESENYYYSNLNKKLFLLLKNIEINEIDFIKAISSPEIHIKKLGYLGMINIEKPEKGILLNNTICKDLKNNVLISNIYNFLGNFNQESARLIDISENLPILDEKNKNYKKNLICQFKYQQIELKIISEKPKNLFVKLQLLFRNKNIELTENETFYLIQNVYLIKCKFTFCKIIQLLSKINSNFIDFKLISFLEQNIISKNVKIEKQIEIAISLEICGLLKKLNKFSKICELFIYRLINSENLNSKYIGNKFAFEFNVLTKVSIEKCIFNLNNNIFYKNLLIKYINNENCIEIYFNLLNKKNELEIIKKIFLITEDKIFKSKILYEVPLLYPLIKNKKLKINIDDIIYSNNINHFPIIYDFYKKNSKINFIEMISNHLNILINEKVSAKKFQILFNFFIFLLNNGNPIINREILLTKKDIKYILPGILMFNLILSDKFMIINNKLISYQLNYNEKNNDEKEINNEINNENNDDDNNNDNDNNKDEEGVLKFNNNKKNNVDKNKKINFSLKNNSLDDFSITKLFNNENEIILNNNQIYNLESKIGKISIQINNQKKDIFKH